MSNYLINVLLFYLFFPGGQAQIHRNNKKNTEIQKLPFNTSTVDGATAKQRNSLALIGSLSLEQTRQRSVYRQHRR
jgi:hypothetical protein